ncbi:hypothetical protein QQ020_14420 [Fulvivirgaceae bacterium BMA12]|uniref:DUF3078 domain-containing protein n=1 Tax=Agaribacillus aureus TaxID=3051825 RepID=A0ABT8L907_9BACT|nr:hypothetical protein [Fulvivirgaceae bacterium BMA12]
MKNLIYIFFFLLVFNTVAQDIDNSQDANVTQESGESEIGGKSKMILERITIIETFQDKLKKSEPATFSYTNPGDTSKSTYLLDLAIGFNIVKSPKSTLAINGEWHRNTQIDKEQKKDLHGMTWNLGISNTDCRWWAIDKNTSLKYSNDRIKNTEGWVFTSYFAPIFSSKFPGILRPNDVHPPEAKHPKFAKIFQYSYDVLGGFEHRETVSKIDSLDGGITSGYFRFKATIYPASALIGNILEIYYDYTYRSDWRSNTFEDTRNREIKKYGFNLKFKIKISDRNDKKIKDAELKVGWEHVNGEDPIVGLEDQEFDKISLKFKF